MLYIGIDPGLSGAIAVLEDTGALVRLVDMPVLTPAKSWSGKRELNEPVIVDILQHYKVLEPCVVILELVHSMRQQGVASTFTFGAGWGTIRGICSALRIGYTLVRPQTWKKGMVNDLITKEMSKDEKKMQSAIRAEQLWEEFKITKKGDHNKADALLIAEWGRREGYEKLEKVFKNGTEPDSGSTFGSISNSSKKVVNLSDKNGNAPGGSDP